MKYLNRFTYWMNLNIGKLGPTPIKHRSAIMILSVLMLFIDPGVEITFGSASLAGFGISVKPEQVIHIGYFLLALLIYRLIAFWASVLLENGTDSNRARRKALDMFDGTYSANEPQPHDMEYVLDSESEEILYKWNFRQALWEFVVPNLLAFIALVIYLIRYIANYWLSL